MTLKGVFMAKKQTFEDKLNKDSTNPLIRIKVIHVDNPNNKSMRFKGKMYSVPDGKNPDQFVKEVIS